MLLLLLPLLLPLLLLLLLILLLLLLLLLMLLILKCILLIIFKLDYSNKGCVYSLKNKQNTFPLILATATNLKDHLKVMIAYHRWLECHKEVSDTFSIIRGLISKYYVNIGCASTVWTLLHSTSHRELFELVTPGVL